jgi:hypothetical protein
MGGFMAKWKRIEGRYEFDGVSIVKYGRQWEMIDKASGFRLRFERLADAKGSFNNFKKLVAEKGSELIARAVEKRKGKALETVAECRKIDGDPWRQMERKLGLTLKELRAHQTIVEMREAFQRAADLTPTCYDEQKLCDLLNEFFGDIWGIESAMKPEALDHTTNLKHVLEKADDFIPFVDTEDLQKLLAEKFGPYGITVAVEEHANA